MALTDKIRGVRGNAWAKLVSGDYEISPQVLHRLGQRLVEEVVKEARKDLMVQRARQAGSSQPEGLPSGEAFFRSFSYRISGQSTVEIVSSWPTIDAIIKGRDPYRMTWLTQDNGVGIVPLQDEQGNTIFRFAPKNASTAWIHPGFARHNFIRRGVEKARAFLAEEVRKEIQQDLTGRYNR